MVSHVFLPSGGFGEVDCVRGGDERDQGVTRTKLAEHVVGDNTNDEAYSVVLGRITIFFRVVCQELGRPAVDGLLGRLCHLGLVRLRCLRVTGQEVAAVFMPRAADIWARQPFLEEGCVLEGEDCTYRGSVSALVRSSLGRMTRTYAQG